MGVGGPIHDPNVGGHHGHKLLAFLAESNRRLYVGNPLRNSLVLQSGLDLPVRVTVFPGGSRGVRGLLWGNMLWCLVFIYVSVMIKKKSYSVFIIKRGYLFFFFLFNHQESKNLVQLLIFLLLNFWSIISF